MRLFNKALTNNSLKTRYLYKLVNNFIGIPFNLVTQTIATRVLGPESYGNFGFLNNFFSQLVSFFDAGTSDGFYTKLSQRQNEKSLLRFYWSFAFVISLLVLITLTLLYMLGLGEIIWPLQSARHVWLAGILGLVTWYSQIILKINDALGLTRASEIIKTLQKIIGLLFLVNMYLWLKFDLSDFYIYQILMVLLLCVGWMIFLSKKNIQLFPSIHLSRDITNRYTKEFYSYSAPLFIYTTFGLIVGVLDRWLLQSFGGSIQQGFYSLSYQIGAICFLFTNAMTPLITREFAIAFGERDSHKMSSMFSKYIPLLFSIAAFFSIYISFNAHIISILIAGDKFQNASTSIAIMAFYPIHQTYGQLNGSLFYATGQTRLYKNIGIFFMPVGLLMTFFFLAPQKMLGMHMGSVGLALKMVILQFMIVNVQLFYNSRFLRLSFAKLFMHQIYIPIILSSLAFFSTFFSEYFFKSSFTILTVSGILYFVATVSAIFIFPSIFFLNRKDLKQAIISVKQWFLMK